MAITGAQVVCNSLKMSRMESSLLTDSDNVLSFSHTVLFSARTANVVTHAAMVHMPLHIDILTDLW